MITPRAYQIEAIEAILARYEQGITKQLVSLPTGTGKTIIFALLAKTLDRKSLIIAHSEELISQACAKVRMIWPEINVGMVKASDNEIRSHVVVASIQTASRSRRLQELKEQGFGLFIIDEAHHATAKTYERLTRELGFLSGDPQKLLVGVTATPKRGDGITLGSIFEEITFERNIATMIRAGYLCPLIGKQIMTQVDIHKVQSSCGDFIAGQLSRIVNTPFRNRLVVEKFQEFAGDRKRAIAFCADVKHAQNLANAFNEAGIKSKAIFGSMDKEKRRRILERFKRGEYSVLTNCQILSEGYDEEAIDCIVLARPTKSHTFFTQMVGRGTRLHPGKTNSLILDFCDSSSRHDICTFQNSLDGIIHSLTHKKESAVTLECDNTISVKIDEKTSFENINFLSTSSRDIDFFDRSRFVWISAGDSWTLTLSKNNSIWVRKDGDGYRIVIHEEGDVKNLSKKSLPLPYAMGIAEDWVRRQKNNSLATKDASWRKESPSKNQIGLLERLGINLNCNSLNRGQVAEVLSQKLAERGLAKVEPATEKQINEMRRLGISFDENISKAEAWKRISDTIKFMQ